MANQSGNLILHVLEEMNEPITLKNIVDKIAEETGVDRSEVQNTVKETVDGGVRYGYIQKKERKYYMAPLKLSGGTSEESNNVEDNLQDRTARRRRRSTSARRVQRRSRRRRSRGSR